MWVKDRDTLNFCMKPLGIEHFFVCFFFQNGSKIDSGNFDGDRSGLPTFCRGKKPGRKFPQDLARALRVKDRDRGGAAQVFPHFDVAGTGAPRARILKFSLGPRPGFAGQRLGHVELLQETTRDCRILPRQKTRQDGDFDFPEDPARALPGKKPGHLKFCRKPLGIAEFCPIKEPARTATLILQETTRGLQHFARAKNTVCQGRTDCGTPLQIA